MPIPFRHRLALPMHGVAGEAANGGRAGQLGVLEELRAVVAMGCTNSPMSP